MAAKPAAAAKSAAEPAHHVAKAAPAAHATHTTKQSAPAADNNSAELASLRAANEDSARAYAELRAEMEGLEKERDFYFEKLRDVEVLLQEVEDKGEGNELTAAVMKILYATADGFEQVADEDAAAAQEPESDLPDGEETY